MPMWPANVNPNSQESVLEWLTHDPRTGRLIWKKHIKARKVGAFACRKSLVGEYEYMVLCFPNRVNAHRVIWVYYHGAIERGLHIDHIDGNRLNNRIENLRLANSTDNNRNAALRSDNKSGVMGVVFNERDKRWRAQIHSGGKQILLGKYEDRRDAIIARKAAEVALGYHENHGREKISTG